jgi:hypothetical protein
MGEKTEFIQSFGMHVSFYAFATLVHTIYCLTNPLLRNGNQITVEWIMLFVLGLITVMSINIRYDVVLKYFCLFILDAAWILIAINLFNGLFEIGYMTAFDSAVFVCFHYMVQFFSKALQIIVFIPVTLICLEFLQERDLERY